MRSLIIYSSHHHENTERLVKALADRYPIDLLDAAAGTPALLEDYDLIGFASGIDFGKFYPEVTSLAQQLPNGKAVFALFTCARDNGTYGSQIQQIAAQRNCRFFGKFGCKGYNTYGPWKLIGGMNKNHPSAEEIKAALRFYENVLEQAAL